MTALFNTINVKQEFYCMPNGLTNSDVRGRWKNDTRKILLKKFKQHLSKLKKGYSQDLVKQTVETRCDEIFQNVARNYYDYTIELEI